MRPEKAWPKWQMSTRQICSNKDNQGGAMKSRTSIQSRVIVWTALLLVVTGGLFSTSAESLYLQQDATKKSLDSLEANPLLTNNKGEFRDPSPLNHNRSEGSLLSGTRQITPTTWTFMVYLSGDNDLDEWADDLFNKLETVANHPNVTILVLWDRTPDGTWDPGSCRYEVQYNSNPGQLADYVENVNRWCFDELNMGDKQILFDFAFWGKSNYPADHYFLSIFDHGGGWAPELPPLQPPPRRAWSMGGTGLSWDDTNEDYISNFDLSWVFASVGHVDLVFYDACLMATLESAYEISDYVDYLVASENLAYATIPYNYYVWAITQTTTPANLANSIVDTYMASLPPGHSGTMTAFQLDAIGDVITAVDSLGQALLPLLTSPNHLEQIASAYLAAQKLDYDGDWIIRPHKEGLVDLYDFAQQIATAVTDTQAISAAQGMMSALGEGFILAEDHKAGQPYTDTLPGIHGVSVYVPFGEELYVGKECLSMTLDICALPPGTQCIKARQYYITTVPPQSAQLRLAQDTQWDEFVNRFIGLYYNCYTPSCASGSPRGVLPVDRPLRILSDPDQRPGPIPLYQIYLPLSLHGQGA